MESSRITQAQIEAARGGDRKAFSGLVGKIRPALETHLRQQAGKRLREKVEIDDLIQETLLRAFRSIGRFHGDDPGAFGAWLRTIADHVVLDQVRKLNAGKGIIAHEVSLDQKRAGGSGKSWEMELAMAASGVTPAHSLRRDERFDRLKQVLGKLKPDHARVIFLARIQGLPIKEVARRMDRTPEATSMLLLRALLKFKAAFGETESFHLPGRSLAEEEGGPDDR